MREDDLPGVFRSGTSEFAALADVPDAALIRRRGDRRRRRNALLSGLLAFAIGAGGGGFAYASFATSSTSTAAGGTAGGASHRGPGSAPPPLSARPPIVAITTAGIVQVLDPETLAVTRTLSGVQDAVGDEIGVSPDAGTVYFAVRHGCEDDVMSVPADGSAKPVFVTKGLLPAVSPDGKKLAVVTEGYGGGPARVSYGCNDGAAPQIVVMDLATKATSAADVPGNLPVSHLSWSPSGGSLLVSAGPGSSNAGWMLSVYTIAGSSFSSPVQVTGDNASSSYYREGVYLPSGDLFVNRLCCTGRPAKPSSSYLLQVDSSGTVQHQVTQGYLDKDHTSLASDRSGQWLLYLSGNDLLVSAGGTRPAQVTIGLIAAAWLLPGNGLLNTQSRDACEA